MDLYLTDEIIGNASLSDTDIATYIALKMRYLKSEKLYNTNGKNIYYFLSGKVCTSNYIADKFNKSILNLESHGLISIVQNHKNEEFEVDLSKFEIVNPKNNYYTIIYDDEVRRIINSGKLYRYKILRYFVYLVSTFMCSTKDKFVPHVSYKPADELATAVNFKDTKTVYRYNKILQDLKLIYVYRAGFFVQFDGAEIKGISNVYGRYKDKDMIIQEGEKYAERYGVKGKSISQLDTAKSTRSASQKFNMWINGKKEYTYDELKDIYTILLDYNKRYEKVDKTKYKDLTVFKDYDFYECIK